MEGERFSDQGLSFRADDWTLGKLVSPPLIEEFFGQSALTELEWSRLEAALLSEDRQSEVVEEVQTYFDRSGAKVVRISARLNGHAKIVGYEVRRDDGLGLKLTPPSGEAFGVAQGEDEMSEKVQPLEQNGGAEGASVLIENPVDQVGKPKSSWKRSGR